MWVCVWVIMSPFKMCMWLHNKHTRTHTLWQTNPFIHGLCMGVEAYDSVCICLCASLRIRRTINFYCTDVLLYVCIPKVYLLASVCTCRYGNVCVSVYTTSLWLHSYLMSWTPSHTGTYTCILSQLFMYVWSTAVYVYIPA